MNVVDSCGWLEYFAGGPNASFFSPVIEDTGTLLLPKICVFEVYKRLYMQVGQAGADHGLVFLRKAQVVDLTVDELASAAIASRERRSAMADAIIWQTAQLHQAGLYTQDADLKELPGVIYRAKPT